MPADADSKLWAELLDRQESDAKSTSYNALVFGIAAILFLIAGIMGALPELGIMAWLGALLFGGMAIYSPFDARLRRDRIRTLRKQLPPSEASGHGLSGVDVPPSASYTSD